MKAWWSWTRYWWCWGVRVRVLGLEQVEDLSPNQEVEVEEDLELELGMALIEELEEKLDEPELALDLDRDSPPCTVTASEG